MSFINLPFETLRPTSDHASATNASRPSEVMLLGVGKRSINARNQSNRLLPAKWAILGK